MYICIIIFADSSRAGCESSLFDPPSLTVVPFPWNDAAKDIRSEFHHRSGRSQDIPQLPSCFWPTTKYLSGGPDKCKRVLPSGAGDIA